MQKNNIVSKGTISLSTKNLFQMKKYISKIVLAVCLFVSAYSNSHGQTPCGFVTDLKVKGVTSTGAIVTWSRPSSGPYTGARIEWKATTGQNWLYGVTGDTLYALWGLDAGMDYDVRVAPLCGSSSLADSDYVYLTLSTLIYPCIAYSTETVDTAETVTSSTVGTTSSLPLMTQLRFSFSEQLIMADEIGEAGNIHAIGWQSTSSNQLRNRRNCSIYLAHTSLDSISDSTYIVPSQMTKVYEGPFDCDPGWNYIEFNLSHFAYNGDSNLLVAVADNSDTAFLGAHTFMGHWAPGKAISLFSNTVGSWNTQDMGHSNTNFRNNMRLLLGECDTQSFCRAPIAYTTLTTTDSIGVAWCSGGDETGWNIYMYDDINGWDFITSTSDNYCYLDNLQSGTIYNILIEANCGDSVYAVLKAVTRCEAFPLPYFEGFEAWETGSNGQLQPCYWRGSSFMPSAVHPPISDLDASSGSKSLLLDGTVSTSTMFVFPLMEDSVNTLQMNFMMRSRTGTGEHTIVIGAVPDSMFHGATPTLNQLLVRFTPIDTVVAESDEWALFERPLRAYSGGAARIAFLSPTGASANTFIDDVSIDIIPSCPHPTGLELDYVTNDSIVVHWDSDTIAQWWIVSNGVSSDFTDTNVYAFSGLDIQTEYTITIRAYCDFDDTSSAISATYSTVCGTLSHLPYFTDFDSVPTTGPESPDFERCWQRYRDYSDTYSGYGMFIEDTATDHYNTGCPSLSGSRYLRIMSPTDLNNNHNKSWVVLPEIDTTAIRVDTLMLRFFARTIQQGTMTQRMEVGVMTHPDSIETFIAVDTVDITTQNSDNNNGYMFCEVPFNRFNGEGSFIALVAERTMWGYSIVVDDLELDYMPACPHVTEFAATFVDNSSVTFTWHEVGDATAWVIEHGPHGFSEGSGITDTAYAIPYTVGGLAAETNYDFVIHPICDSYSEPVRVNQATAQFYYTLPYHEDFSNSATPSHWNFLAHRTGSGISFTEPVLNSWAIGNATGNGDNHSLYITPDSGATYDYYYNRDAICMAWTDIMLPDSGTYAYSFDYRCGDGDMADFMEVVLIPASTQIEWNTSVNGMYSTFIDGGSSYSHLASDDWATHSGTVLITPTANYRKPGVYHLLVYWRNDGAKYNGSSSYGGVPAAIDNIHFIRETCPSPTAISVLYVGADTMRVSWTPHSSMQGSFSNWLVSVGNQTQTVTGPPYVCAFNGLQPETDYTITVSPLCSDGDTGLPLIAHQATICGPVQPPYYCNFDNITTSTTASTGIFPNCWEYRMITTTSSPTPPQLYYDSQYAHSGNYSLHSTSNTYIILPDIVPTLDSVKLSFWCYGGSGNISVGVMYSNLYYNAQTISGNWNNWTKHIITFPLVNSGIPVQAIQSGRICIRCQSPYGSASAYFDDIAITYYHSCQAVTDFHTTSATANTVTLDWTDSIAQQWVIEFGPIGGPMAYDTVFSHPAVVPFPANADAAEYRVRPICDEDEVGDWSSTVLVNSPYCPGGTEVSTGSGSTTNFYFPLSRSYSYSFTETIITAEELAGTNDITDIAFFYDYQPCTGLDSVDIYLQPTTINSFGLTFEPVDSLNAVLVYSGALNFNIATGWNYFSLDTPYTYSGTGNLMLIVNNRSNPSAYGNSRFRMTANGSFYQCLGQYSNDAPFDPYNPNRNNFSQRERSRVMMRLIGCSLPCPQPTSAHMGNIGPDHADLFWTVADAAPDEGTASTYQIQIEEILTGVIVIDTLVTATGESDYQLFIDGLDYGTDYQYSIRTICEDNVTSLWLAAPFSTPTAPCEAPSRLTTDSTTWNSATFDWTPNAGEQRWLLRIWNTAYDSTYEVNSHPVTIDGLGEGVNYMASVRAYCHTYDIYSSPSDTVVFATSTCPIPTNVTLVNRTTTSATISWSNTTGLYSVEYGTANFSQGMGTLISNLQEPTVTIEGLQPNTYYDFYVRSHCTETVASQWTDHFTFSTTAEGIVSAGNSASYLVIHPNPANKETILSINGLEGEMRVTVTNVTGQKLITESFYCDGRCNHTISLGNLTAGAYFVSLQSGDHHIVRKLIVRQ